MIFLFYLSAQLRVSIQEVGSYIPGAVNCVRVLLTSTTLVIVRTGWISCRRPKTSKNSFYLMSVYVCISFYFLFSSSLKVTTPSLIFLIFICYCFTVFHPTLKTTQITEKWPLKLESDLNQVWNRCGCQPLHHQRVLGTNAGDYYQLFPLRINCLSASWGSKTKHCSSISSKFKRQFLCLLMRWCQKERRIVLKNLSLN